MKRTDVEHLVRQMAWPEPPASLRARVLSDIPIAEQPIAGAARVAGSQDPARRTRIAHENARLGHGWRRASVLVGLGILIMLGSCTGFDVWADRQVEAEIARIEARYGSLNEKTQARSVPAADNRARMVRAAAALAVGLPGRRYHYLDWPMPSPVPDNLRAFADANRDAIRLAAEVRNRHESDWEVDRTGEIPWNDMSVLTDAIYVSALIDVEAGRADEAAQLIVSGLSITASLQELPENSMLMALSFNLTPRQFQAIRQLLNASAPSKGALRALASWLDENRKPNGTRAALLAEVRATNAMFARMERGDIDANTAGWIYPMTWPKWPKAFLGIAAQVGRPFVRTARLRYLQSMRQLLDAETGARPRPVLPEPRPAQRWALVDRLAEKFAAEPWNYSEIGDDFASQLSAAELAVALRRFKLDHRSYPDDLSALAPTYLTRLPIDPFTGQPPIYARTGEGFALRAKGSRPGLEKWFALEWNVPK